LYFCAKKILDKRDVPIIPFNTIANNKHVPDPRSIIQIALSSYRNSGVSDEELATHICQSLMLLMTDYDLHIDVYNGNPHGLFFAQK